MVQVVKMVQERTGIDAGQARTAVSTVLEFLKERLPEPIAGQIDGVVSARVRAARARRWTRRAACSAATADEGGGAREAVEHVERVREDDRRQCDEAQPGLSCSPAAIG